LELPSAFISALETMAKVATTLDISALTEEHMMDLAGSATGKFFFLFLFSFFFFLSS
jgi:hypothetical protein